MKSKERIAVLVIKNFAMIFSQTYCDLFFY